MVTKLRGKSNVANVENKHLHRAQRRFAGMGEQELSVTIHATSSLARIRPIGSMNCCCRGTDVKAKKTGRRWRHDPLNAFLPRATAQAYDMPPTASGNSFPLEPHAKTGGLRLIIDCNDWPMDFSLRARLWDTGHAGR